MGSFIPPVKCGGRLQKAGFDDRQFGFVMGAASIRLISRLVVRRAGEDLAIWMQNVGAAWLMMSLTSSPMLVALVQTAISLPAFSSGLPGGVFADIFNRRRYLLVTQIGMLFTAAVLITCSALGRGCC